METIRNETPRKLQSQSQPRRKINRTLNRRFWMSDSHDLEKSTDGRRQCEANESPKASSLLSDSFLVKRVKSVEEDAAKIRRMLNLLPLFGCRPGVAQSTFCHKCKWQTWIPESLISPKKIKHLAMDSRCEIQFELTLNTITRPEIEVLGSWKELWNTCRLARIGLVGKQSFALSPSAISLIFTTFGD